MSKHKCPLCPKVYQSEKKLDGHCKKIHGISLKDLRWAEGGMTIQQAIIRNEKC